MPLRRINCCFLKYMIFFIKLGQNARPEWFAVLFVQINPLGGVF